MTHLNKIAAAGAVAMMLAPSLAFAHTEASVGVKARIEQNLIRIEHKGDVEARKGAHKTEVATTTAARTSKEANKIKASADMMLSFNDRIQALIASSSADAKADLQNQFNTFKTAAVNAQTKAAAAISVAAQVNANNSTTTNASLNAEAKADVKAGKGFLHDAMKSLFGLLHDLWK